MRVTRTWRIWLCAVLLSGGAALWAWSASQALAYTEPSGLSGHDYSSVCPPRPADAGEGASATEVDLVTVAQEQADACFRREQLAEQQHKDLEAVSSDLTKTLKTTVEGEPTVKIGNWESAPASSTVELSTAAKAELDGNAQAIHDDLWFVIGALLAIAVVGVLYAEIRPKR